MKNKRFNKRQILGEEPTAPPNLIDEWIEPDGSYTKVVIHSITGPDGLQGGISAYIRRSSAVTEQSLQTKKQPTKQRF